MLKRAITKHTERFIEAITSHTKNMKQTMTSHTQHFMTCFSAQAQLIRVILQIADLSETHFRQIGWWWDQRRMMLQTNWFLRFSPTNQSQCSILCMTSDVLMMFSDGVKDTSLKAKTRPSRPRPRTSKLSSRIREDEDLFSRTPTLVMLLLFYWFSQCIIA